MADTLLPDDPQTVQRLDSVACLLEWMRSMPAPTRKRFFGAIAECSDAVQQVVVRLLVVVKNPKTTAVERQRALMTIADALFPNSDESGEYGLDLVTSEAGAAAENPDPETNHPRWRQSRRPRTLPSTNRKTIRRAISS